MTVLTAPRHPMVNRALAQSHVWCRGHVIDDRPAIRHAIAVALTLDDHVAGCPPELICAVLLHDSPDFAPADLDLDAYLTSAYSPAVIRVIRALQREHAALDTDSPTIVVDDRDVLLASTADKIVALTSLMHRARLSGDVTAFFTARGPLVWLLPHFRAYQRATALHVPPTMTVALGAALDRLDQATEGLVAP